MDKQLEQDEILLGSLLQPVRKFAGGFRSGDGRPSGSPLVEIPASPLPEVGAGARDAMKVFAQRWSDYFVASSSNRYPGYVIGETTPAALAGDWVTSATDQNPQAVRGSAMSPQLRALAKYLNDRGRYLLTPTTLSGRRGLPATFVNWQCETSQVGEIVAELSAAPKELPLAPAAPPVKNTE